MERSHVPEITTLWGERIGTPADARNPWIEHALDRTRPTEIFIAITNDEVIGFGVATIGGPEWVTDYINHPDGTITCWPNTGVLHAVAVDHAYQSQGVGTALFALQLEYLTAVGADGVLGVSWHRDEHYDSRGLFNKFDFTVDETFPEFYAITSGETYCVDCTGECMCGSTVFIRDLPVTRDEIQSTIYP